MKKEYKEMMCIYKGKRRTYETDVADIAQLVEHSAVNRNVPGSSPGLPAKQCISNVMAA
jgi:hypothetical protein